MSDPVRAWLEGILRKVVREELAAVQHPSDGWRDQRHSALGPRRHCLAVRRRLHADPRDSGAKIIGDRYLLTPDAILEELDRLGRKPDAPREGAGGAKDRRPDGSARGARSDVRAPQSPEAEAVERVKRRLGK